jgi:hypothetical protein
MANNKILKKGLVVGIIVCMMIVISGIPITGQVTKNIIIRDSDGINPSFNGNTWRRTFGGADYDSAYDGHQTSDGGYIVVGYTRSFSVGGSDIWLIKVDSNGNMEWDKTFGSPNNESGYAVKQTIDGGYIVTGEISQGTTYPQTHVCLIKTNDKGELQWEKTYFSGVGLDVCQIDDEGYVVVGDFYDNKNLMKVDKDGNEMWNKSIGEKFYLYSIHQTNDGGFIMVGFSCLIKTDSDGMQEWTVTFDSGMVGLDVLQTIDGGYTAVGYEGDYFESTGWMLRTDENGNIIDKKKYIDYKTYYGINSLYQTSDGGYIITGRISLYRPYGLCCLLLAKTDETGKIQWQKRYYGTWDPYDQGWAVQQTTDGGYFVVGSMIRGISYPQRDVWLIKTDANGNAPRDKAISSSLFYRFLERFPLLNLLLQRLRI